MIKGHFTKVSIYLTTYIIAGLGMSVVIVWWSYRFPLPLFRAMELTSSEVLDNTWQWVLSRRSWNGSHCRFFAEFWASFHFEWAKKIRINHQTYDTWSHIIWVICKSIENYDKTYTSSRGKKTHILNTIRTWALAKHLFRFFGHLFSFLDIFPNIFISIFQTFSMPWMAPFRFSLLGNWRKKTKPIQMKIFESTVITYANWVENQIAK